MKKTIQYILTLFLAFAIIIPQMAPVSASGRPEKVNYMAFGDSVAAGVRGGVGLPGFEFWSDKGYTNLIAEKLRNIGILDSFNKDFCISGETAKGLAQRTAVLTDPDSTAAALAGEADIMTLDIGANDLLWPLYTYFTKLDNVMNFDISEFKQLVNEIIDNLYNGTTGTDVQKYIRINLENMLTANGSAHIFVMGYYNPLPALSAMLDIDFNEPTKYLNTLIQKAISDVKDNYPQASISYVPTFDAMAGADGSLVPIDIHPTEAGYEVIADAFWQQIKPLEMVSRAAAAVSSWHFTLNDNAIPLCAYIINDNNYIMLRDFAMVLDGTSKTFSVSWDGTLNVVAITSGQPYTPVGSELAVFNGSENITATLSDSSLVMNGKTLNLTAYMIGGHNYLKLRDLAGALDIALTWDSQTNIVKIDLSRGYTPPAD